MLWILVTIVIAGIGNNNPFVAAVMAHIIARNLVAIAVTGHVCGDAGAVVAVCVMPAMIIVSRIVMPVPRRTPRTVCVAAKIIEYARPLNIHRAQNIRTSVYEWRANYLHDAVVNVRIINYQGCNILEIAVSQNGLDKENMRASLPGFQNP